MKVNHLLIGAGRSGSTTLCKYIEQHPQVCFSKLKEVHFFSQSDLFERGIDYYHGFFDHCGDEKLWVSADTYLLIDYKAIHRIHSYNKDMKIVVILRDPVERAFSSFVYAKNYGYQKNHISFIESLKQENELFTKQTGIIQMNNLAHFYSGLYYRHLQEWMRVFPPENFFITTTRTLNRDPQEVMDKYCTFAQIESNKINTTIHLNPTAKARFVLMEQILLNRETRLRRFIRNYTPQKLKHLILNSGLVDKLHSLNRKNVQKEKLTQEERKMAMPYFADDMQKLESHFGIRFND